VGWLDSAGVLGLGIFGPIIYQSWELGYWLDGFGVEGWLDD